MTYYRNNIDLMAQNGEFVDEGSLWRRDGELMILVDEDRHVTFPYSATKFYPVNLSKHESV